MHEQHHTKRQQWGRRAFTLATFLALGFILNIVVAWGSMGGLRAGWLNAINSWPRVQLGSAIVGSQFIFINRSDTLLISRLLVQSQHLERPIDFERTRQASIDAGGPVIEDAQTIIPSWTDWRVDSAASDAMPIVIPLSVKRVARHMLPAEVVPDEVTRVFGAFGMPFRSILQTSVEPRVDLPKGISLSQFALVLNPGAPVVNFWPPSVAIGGAGYPLRPVWPGTLFNTAIYAAPFFALWRILIALRRRRRRKRNQCIACAYSLVGLTTPACPECGRPLPLPLGERGRAAAG